MKRHLVVLTAVMLAAGLAGCTDDKSPEAKASPAAPSASLEESLGPKIDLPESPSAPSRSEADTIAATGYGAFEVGAARTELEGDGLIESVKDTGGGCATATGSTIFNPPALTFSQGKLTQVRVTAGEGSPIGRSLAEVQAAYPGGGTVTGLGGATGYSVPSESNTLLFEIKADKVVAVTAGDAATVTKLFTTGQGC
ncbi:hypothetical protein Acy02nite_44800 [Actinoplanes cyaneus]|uniref:Lipoprotein n=1 Tax=Actinoplanes cyaneus TaxID=52696 RepID=A0A919IIV8_9ACTN|nr:hypothetical protein [Actinoplanes cyaneus]GID66599.1 hypothetical protein Acy02nite_44800 [Actinoplanes cyaneus]